MKKIYTLLVASCLAFSASAQQRESRATLSPLTKKYMADLHKRTQPVGYNYKQHHGQVFVAAVIKVADAAQAAAGLEAIGAHVGTKAGVIWTVQVPLPQVKAFTELKGISYIQLDEPLRPNLDAARTTTRVDSVHGGYALPYPFTGIDIVVGVIDFGFDYTHPTFYDTMGTNYRVKRVWELNTTGTPPSGYNYGHELTTTASILAQGTDNAEQTHGTAVAGMSSGSGFGSKPASNRFRGMAFNADMVFVGVRRDSIEGQWMSSGFSDFIDGVNYIFDYATSVNKPCVVNISWGSQSGPHDGTSLFAQACDYMSGQGKMIVMSAGNDGQELIHLSKTFTPADTLLNTFVTFSSNAYKRTWIDVWGDTGKNYCIEATLYKNGVAGNTTGFICIDDLIHNQYLISANGLDTCFIDFITSSSEFNQKPRYILNIWNRSNDTIGIRIKGTDGSIDAWNESYYFGYVHKYSSSFEGLGVAGYTTGNAQSTVSDMGSARSVLLVGAYASKVGYTDIANNNWSYSSYVGIGNIVPFSSLGPMADGRIKPDITAPGITIATATSSFDTAYTPTGSNKNQVTTDYVFNGKTYYYAQFSGTSASAPAASGIVALMLQANPKMDPQQIKTIIAATAIEDNRTGNLPPGGNNTWGAGKINAYGAVRMALQQNSVYDFKGEKIDCVLFPNPGDGEFTLEYTGNRSRVLNVSVYNLTGSLVYSSDWKVNAGTNRRQLQLSALSSGIYVAKISSDKGATTIKLNIR